MFGLNLQESAPLGCVGTTSISVGKKCNDEVVSQSPERGRTSEHHRPFCFHFPMDRDGLWSNSYNFIALQSRSRKTDLRDA